MLVRLYLRLLRRLLLLLRPRLLLGTPGLLVLPHLQSARLARGQRCIRAAACAKRATQQRPHMQQPCQL